MNGKIIIFIGKKDIVTLPKYLSYLKLFLSLIILNFLRESKLVYIALYLFINIEIRTDLRRILK